MRNSVAYLFIALCLFVSSCHRPYAYFQRSPREQFASTQPNVAPNSPIKSVTDSSIITNEPDNVPTEINGPALASLLTATKRAEPTGTRIQRRLHRAQSLLATPTTAADKTTSTDKQPRPKPQKKMRLGNRIREKLGVPLRKELNWWQRISWKLKASVIVILLAVVFAILKITILAVIFGLLGAFLLISGLRRSFKARRPWF